MRSGAAADSLLGIALAHIFHSHLGAASRRLVECRRRLFPALPRVTSLARSSPLYRDAGSTSFTRFIDRQVERRPLLASIVGVALACRKRFRHKLGTPLLAAFFGRSELTSKSPARAEVGIGSPLHASSDITNAATPTSMLFDNDPTQRSRNEGRARSAAVRPSSALSRRRSPGSKNTSRRAKGAK